MLYNGVSKYQVILFALISEAGVKSKGLILAVYSDPGFEILSDSLFKEVCLPLEANRLHPFEGVSNPVMAVAPEAEEELIGAKFDVIAHHVRVHSNQFDGESIDHEFHFDFDRAAYDFGDGRDRELVYEFQVEEACKVAVHSLSRLIC
jgi:hypothetical protein